MVSSPSQRTASKHLSQVVKSLRKVGHSSLKTRLAFPCELVMEARLHYLSDARVPLMICPFTKWPLRGTGPVVGWCILFLVRFRIKNSIDPTVPNGRIMGQRWPILSQSEDREVQRAKQTMKVVNL
jgi:hypothetical protein